MGVKRLDRRGFEFSFSLMFALIVGAAILFLALYFSGAIIKGSSYQRDTEIAKELTILFDPFETGFAETKVATINLPSATRIITQCSREGNFGYETLASSEQSFGTWSDPGGAIKITNRYVFADELEEGKFLYLFSKNFEMPFKVSEIILMSTRNYCFSSDVPNEIKDELTHLNLKSLEFGLCSPGSLKVCTFGNCDIKITGSCVSGCNSKFDSGTVVKQGKTLYYDGNLVYAAIFSSPEIYECNVKRLAQRTAALSSLYKDQNLLNTFCGNAIDSPLLQLEQQAEQFSDSRDLLPLRNAAHDLQAHYENLNDQCKIWTT